MFDLLFIISIVGFIVNIIKENCMKEIPAENWGNKKLYHDDIMSGISDEQLMKNVKNGKYRMVKPYQEPHRDPKSGKIIIENNKLYYEDLEKYGAVQVMEWVRSGRYNLTAEEFEKEKKRIMAKYERPYN